MAGQDESLVPDDLRGRVLQGDNLPLIEGFPDACVDLIYIDPPFNTGKVQKRVKTRTVRDDNGDRTGFGGKRYRTETLVARQFDDQFDDYLQFLEPRLRQAHRLLRDHGSFYFHIDYREAHYCKIMLDAIFGRDAFLNEIIWAYDYGGRPKNRWPPKHDTILVYAKSPGKHVFNIDGIDRIPYMAPGLVSAEKAKRGKLPTDTWWHTIVSPTGKEKLGYPTQKPLGILRRIVQASAPAGGTVLDFFAGSGTTGAACLAEGRRFVLIDQHPDALEVMRTRFADEPGVVFEDVTG